MNRSASRQQPTNYLAQDTLHLFVLSSFAFAQPLFDILSKYPVFFIAHKSEPEDIFTFSLIILLAIPMFLAVIEMAIALISQKLRKIVHYSFVEILVGIIALPILSNNLPTISAIQIPIIIVICFLFFLLYRSSNLIGTFLNFASFALLAFPLLFLFNSDIHRLAFSTKSEQLLKVDVPNPIPVVIVVLDEFNATSIMNKNHEIDYSLFPNIAKFASKAFWYRNASGISDSTHYAVPAISTGLYAGKRQPTADDYPQSIFSVLGRTHLFNVFESVTKLCAPLYCPDADNRKTFHERLSNLMFDSSIVYLHILVPEFYSEFLPAINQGWANFIKTGTTSELSSDNTSKGGWMGHVGDSLKLDRSAIFRNFIDKIPELNNGPSLNYLHILLPHVPYQYLPSGKNYGAVSLTGLQHENTERWGGDKWAILQSWQRYRMQLVFTDSLLGELFLHLKGLGMYEDSLIIITADHGVSHRENKYRRVGTHANYMDILPVPLLMKVPHQKEGVISDANVETIDIFPTIAGLMGIDLPMNVDGISVFDYKKLETRTEKRLYIDTSAKTIIVPDELPERYETLKNRLVLFGAGSLYNKLYSIGKDSHLVGKKIAPLLTEGKLVGSSVQLDGNYLSRTIARDEGPNYVRGTLFQELPNGAQAHLALSVNGTIRGVTKTLQSLPNAPHEFSFVVPEEAYEDEINKIEILAIGSNGSGSTTLSQFKSLGTYQLLHSDDGKTFHLQDPTGVRIPIRSETLKGYIDNLSIRGGLLEVSGWAADLKNQVAAKLVAIFINGECVQVGRPRIARRDVAKILNEPAYLLSGYSIAMTIPHEYLNENFQLKVFAISESQVASQLIVAGKVVSEIESIRSKNEFSPDEK